MQINITLFSSTNMKTKCIIATITAGIIAAGLIVIASFSGSVLAASSGSSAEFSGGVPILRSHAEADPGQAGCATFTVHIQQGSRPITLMDISCAASDTGAVGVASGIGATCGTGVNAGIVGSCAHAFPGPASTPNPNSISNTAPHPLIALPLP